MSKSCGSCVWRNPHTCRFCLRIVDQNELDSDTIRRMNDIIKTRIVPKTEHYPIRNSSLGKN